MKTSSLTTVLLYFLLSACASQNDSSEFAAQQQSLQKKMSHSYCYQYMYGSYSTQVNAQKARSWCLKSSQAGNTNSMVLLAELFFYQKVAELSKSSNHKQAHYWYKKAARQGHVHAQYMLAHLYQQGLGTNQSDSQASHWREQARVQRHPSLIPNDYVGDN